MQHRTYCWVLICLAVASLFAVLAPLAFGQNVEPGFYPYGVFNSKPLEVGDSVWVNVGETECAYGGLYPGADDSCMQEYALARVVAIFQYGDYWFYRVAVSLSGEDFEEEAEFGNLYEAYNLPQRWAAYSRYFLALYW
ncbi:MAG: hypothetical protein PHI73_01200 [Patescibacteria group bacterium]|nr:hypothetical protein [Patescibacteria group bacterium]